MRRWLPIVVAALIVALGAGIAWTLRQDQQAEVVAVAREAGGRTRSGRIVEPWDRIDGDRWYTPDLQEVPVVVPDRPHDPDEVEQARGGRGGLQRTRTFHVSTGSLRLRGGDPTGADTRILVLGDSTAAGWGVDDPETWPRVLERSLRASGWDVDVLNAGVPANPVRTMDRWCRALGPELDVDILLWVRRPEDLGPGPLAEYAEGVAACAEATGASAFVFLPPVSTFDPYGATRWPRAAPGLRERLPASIPVVELTPLVREAQAGRGDVMRRATDGGWEVVDDETGAVLFTAPDQGERIPAAVLQAFERDPALREWMFFDEGHLDANGQEWMAGVVQATLAGAGRR